MPPTVGPPNAPTSEPEACHLPRGASGPTAPRIPPRRSPDRVNGTCSSGSTLATSTLVADAGPPTIRHPPPDQPPPAESVVLGSVVPRSAGGPGSPVHGTGSGWPEVGWSEVGGSAAVAVPVGSATGPVPGGGGSGRTTVAGGALAAGDDAEDDAGVDVERGRWEVGAAEDVGTSVVGAATGTVVGAGAA